MKLKGAVKNTIYQRSVLENLVLQTTKMAADVVGSTLGPYGRVVLIERSENLPPYTTKDGITVFQALGVGNSVGQVVLEALRDSSSKTNIEAGDGTTTATVLAHAIIAEGFKVLQNQHLSAQLIMREIEQVYVKYIQPFIQERAIAIKQNNTENLNLLRQVALISTNSDAEMADAVLQCFDIVGFDGHVNIVEAAGASGYEVEKIEGFPIAKGFEESCGRYLEEFINDRGNYKVSLEKPRFILYNGKLNSLSSLLPALEKISAEFEQAVNSGDKQFSPNFVLVAHQFSDEVLAALAFNFKNPSTLNIFPLKTPITIQTNSPYHFLLDLAAFTGATIFDPISRPLSTLQMSDLGLPSMNIFEAYRYRSVVLGEPDEMIVMMRVEELTQQAQNAASSLDAELTRERLGVLTGGIARLRVKGSSESELKEKKHRVEDAVLAVKGALKWGVLPGGAKTLLALSEYIKQQPIRPEVKQILSQAFLAPFVKILTNGGYSLAEIESLRKKLLYKERPLTFWEKVLKAWDGLKNSTRGSKDNSSTKYLDPQPFWYTHNLITQQFGLGYNIGVVDSAAAVLLAIKNAISVAKMLMGLSAIIAYQRDIQLEREAHLQALHDDKAMKQAEHEVKAQEYNAWQRL